MLQEVILCHLTSAMPPAPQSSYSSENQVKFMAAVLFRCRKDREKLKLLNFCLVVTMHHSNKGCACKWYQDKMPSIYIEMAPYSTLQLYGKLVLLNDT